MTLLLDAIMAMSGILVSWLVLGLAILGVGELALRCMRSRDLQAPVFTRFWVGVATVVGLLQVWHLVLPVDARATLMLVLLGLLGCWLCRVELRSSLLDSRWILIVSAIWLANRALGPGDATDSGMYHYPAVDWINQFAIVPGLGNFSSHQAMNNASFLFNALCNAWPWMDRGEHLCNGLLLLPMLVMGVRGLLDSRERFAMLLLPMVLLLSLGGEITSFDNDLPAGLMLLAGGVVLIRNRGRLAREVLPTLALLFTAAACMKLSVALIGIVLLGAVALHALVRERGAVSVLKPSPLGGEGWVGANQVMDIVSQRSPPPTPSPKGRGLQTHLALFISIAIGLLLVLPWLARNIVMTGYPLYPMTVASVDADWKMPERLIEEHLGGIHAHSRYTLPAFMASKARQQNLDWLASALDPKIDSPEQLTMTNWIVPWVIAMHLMAPVEVVVPVVATILLIGAWLLARHRIHVQRDWPMLVLVGSGVCGAVFWFVQAPDPRFGWPALWLIALGVGALFFEHATKHRLWIALTLIACILALSHKAVTEKIIHKRNPIARIPIMLPGPDHGMHPRPQTDYDIVTTRGGVRVHMPADKRSQVWYGPLPRVGWPPLEMDLHYRSPGELQRGFRIQSPAD